MRTASLAFALLWRFSLLAIILGLCFNFMLVVFSAVGVEAVSDRLTSSVAYIKAKPSLAYVAIATALILVRATCRINLLQAIWGKRLSLSSVQWQAVLLRLVVLLIVLALANLLVASLFSTSFWVNYKLFGAPSFLIGGHLVVAHTLVRSAP